MERRKRLANLPLTEEQKRLCGDNIRLVKWACGRLLKGLMPEEFDDACSHLHVGLIRAAQLYEPERGFTFSTYARYWLRQSAWRWLQARELRRQTPVLSQLAPRTGTEDQWCYDPADNSDEPDKAVMVRELVEECRRHVNERQWTLLRMRFIEGMTLEEAGAVLGITRERVRQLQDRLLARLYDCCLLKVGTQV